VRALILALVRFGIASKAQTRALEKAWAEYESKAVGPRREASGSFATIDDPTSIAAIHFNCPESRQSVHVPTSGLPPINPQRIRC
jgi:hypothetical protein